MSVLADPDGYEVAVLGAAGFYDLARPRYDAVDWRLREARGADGREPPPSTAPLATPGMVNVHDAAALDALASSQDRVVAHFAAKWCKNCARMEPELAAMAAKTDAHAFALIDVDEAEDLAAKYNVTSVPHFVFLKDGKEVDSLEGADPKELDAKISKLVEALPAPATANGGAAKTEEEEKEALNARLAKLIKSDTIVLFMKGSPSEPRCGFSKKAVGMLNDVGAKFGHFDILSDQSVRQGLKEYSNWPTYPQLYVKGELMGGMHMGMMNPNMGGHDPQAQGDSSHATQAKRPQSPWKK